MFFRFHKGYFLIFLCLFITEIIIAAFVHDNFIRPYAGDFLVVIMIYCFVMGWVQAPVTITAIAVLLFAFLVETLQYFNLVRHLGLQHSRLAVIIIGNHFAWSDIIAYTSGVLLILCLEYLRRVKVQV
jgi:hypothetical protein